MLARHQVPATPSETRFSIIGMQARVACMVWCFGLYSSMQSGTYSVVEQWCRRLRSSNKALHAATMADLPARRGLTNGQ